MNYSYDEAKNEVIVHIRPISIKPEGQPVIAGFCSTIMSDIPIALCEEKKTTDIWY